MRSIVALSLSLALSLALGCSDSGALTPDVVLDTSTDGNSNFDCGGYYSTIVEKREAMQDANGCFLMGRWSLDTGKPDVAYSYLAGPVCWKPFPFGSLIDVSFGSAFNSP